MMCVVSLSKEITPVQLNTIYLRLKYKRYVCLYLLYSSLNELMILSLIM